MREKVWQDDKVEWWYAQNILVFSRKNYLARNPLLKKEFERAHPSQRSIVHPKKYLELVQLQLTMQDIANLIPREDRFILVDQEQLRECMVYPTRLYHFWNAAGSTGDRRQMMIQRFENSRDCAKAERNFWSLLGRHFGGSSIMKPFASIWFQIFAAWYRTIG